MHMNCTSMKAIYRGRKEIAIFWQWEPTEKI